MPEIPEHVFLICTIGGSTQATVHSLVHWQVDKILFVVSEDTSHLIKKITDDFARQTGRKLSPGVYDYLEIDDSQDLNHAVEKVRSFTEAVYKWDARGQEYSVIADITGGTKCMSSALSLVARCWPCEFSYVDDRICIDNSANPTQAHNQLSVYSANPWEALGYQYVDDAVRLFNNNLYNAASALLGLLIENHRISEGYMKQQIVAMWQLALAYSAWDTFKHADASSPFDKVIKSRNDLEAALSRSLDGLYGTFEAHRNLCRQLAEDTKDLDAKDKLISENVINDLLANADRRAASGHFDDAIARLYRATEAIAQHELFALGFTNTGDVPLDKLPQPLHDRLAGRAVEGTVKLGLQDDYTLLKLLDNGVGKRFFDANLDRRTSALNQRNSSILAHGFKSCTQKAFNTMRQKVHDLAGNPDLDHFQFPHLPGVQIRVMEMEH